MALQVWLPLNGNLNNYGVSNMKFSNTSTSTLTVDASGKLGSCYKRSSIQTAGRIISDTTINLSSDISMCCWAKVTGTVGDTANGLVSNHSHANNTGFGITVKQVSSSDFRISCNTGNGSSRTYCTYYGNTNIKDAWHHLALTYSSKAQSFSLWVDGVAEKTVSYTNASISDYIMVFDWSTTYSGSDYKPACSINDVRIYDHCLSKKEIKEIAKGLVLHYPLDTSNKLNSLGLSTMTLDDGTVWAKVLHHNNPADYRFTSSNASNYNDGSNLMSKLYLLTTNNFKSTDNYYEFLAVQAVSAGDSETKYRWKQTSAPASNTSVSGFTSISGSPSGGLCLCNGATYLAVSNTTNNWWQACGCYTKYSTGLPGFGSVSVGTGFLDLYVRIDNTQEGITSEIIDASGYKNNSSATGNISIIGDSKRYGNSLYIPNDTSHTTLLNTSVLQTLTNCTISWWYKPVSIRNTVQFKGQSDYYYIAAYNSSNFYNSYASITAKLYVDGIEKPISSTSGGYVAYYSTTLQSGWHHYCLSGANISTWTAFQIGGYGSWNIYGYTSDVRIYATALSADDVYELYAASALIDKNGDLMCYQANEIYNNVSGRELGPHVNKGNSNVVFNADGSYTISGHTWPSADYIPISPTGKTYYYDIEYSNVSGNLFYIGFEKYDVNYGTGSNQECQYQVGSTDAADHKRIKGTINLATANGNTAAYTRLRILNDWNSTGTASYKGTIHHISLKEVSSTNGVDINKKGMVNADDFIESSSASINKIGNMTCNQLIEF